MLSKPAAIFFSYSHKDELFREQLETHLSMLKRQGLIKPWHDRMITAGDEWKGQIDDNLNAAEIVLLLITANFLASDYCYDIEMKRAMERHEIGEARVVPIILTPVEGWMHSPFAKLQALPKDGQPVTKWNDRDEAFVNVAQGIRETVLSLSELTASVSIDDLVQQVQSRYYPEVLDRHGKIRLLNSIEVKVDQLYVDVWVLRRVANTFQMDMSALLRLFDFRRDRLGLGERIERDKGIDVANQYSKLLILGKPGAGKTTFMKHLAVACCKPEFQASLVPVLIELRSIQSESFELLNAIHQELKLSNIQDTRRFLQNGKLFVLLDGLDEIPSQFRRSVQTHIRDFANSQEHNKNRFVLTCRTQIIEYPPDGFKSVEVADFNKKQVNLFIDNWFKASISSKRISPKKASQLKSNLSKNEGLFELAKTPIILSLICWVFEDSGSLPNQRSWLYRKGLDLLLKRWDGFREINREVGHEAYRLLTLKQKELLLSEIAALKFQQSENFVLFEEENLIEQVVNILQISDKNGKSVLKAIEAQHGLLIERADEIWSFSHLTFQEYFAAKWFAERNDLEGLANQVIHPNRDRWRQVFLLAMEFTPTDNLANLLKKRIDQSVSDDPKLRAFIYWVKSKSESINATYKTSAVRSVYIAFAINSASNNSFNLTSIFKLARELDDKINYSITHYSFDVDSALIRNISLDHSLSSDVALELILGITTGKIPRPPLFDLVIALDHICTGENLVFDSELQKLRNKLPKKYEINPKQEHRWWQVHGQFWIEEFRKISIEYQNIGHDWQFSYQQKQRLQEYYFSNEFLISLLKEDCGISPKIYKKIEEELFLPFT